MELRIHSQLARLGLDISKHQFNLKVTQPKLQMQTAQPELRMSQAKVSLSIDQDQCFEDVNRRKIIPFGIYSRDQAKQKTSRAIAKIVQEGNQLAAIDQGYTVAMIARQAMNTKKDFNIDFIPKHRPEIRVQQTPLKMDYQAGSIQLNLQRGQVQSHLNYGDVKVYYEQRPTVDISVVPSKFDRVG